MSSFTHSFWLYGKDGTRFQAHIVHKARIDTSSNDGNSSLPGSKMCLLHDGTPLTYIDGNTFKNVLTGELLSRDGSTK